MRDNPSAFNSTEYNEKIKLSLPFYDEFFNQIIETVRVINPDVKSWLDVGCGTGNMAGKALESFDLDRFAFSDCSEAMLCVAKSRFSSPKTEFILSPSEEICFTNEFDVVTAVMVNHFLTAEGRKTAVRKSFDALKNGGVFITFENFAPESELCKELYLKRWQAYQQGSGKTEEESEKHVRRYGIEYFPITIAEQLSVLYGAGFRTAELLWVSCMQAGFIAIK